jgi:hypothetical protein
MPIADMELREELADLLDDEAILFDHLDSAIIGHGRQHGGRVVAIYSYAKIVEALMENGEVDFESAQEWADFNVVCLYAGPGTPIILYDLDRDS